MGKAKQRLREAGLAGTPAKVLPIVATSTGGVGHMDPVGAAGPATPMEDKGKTLAMYREIYTKDPSRGIRQVSTLQYCRDMMNDQNISWEQYCDLKIKTFTDYWTLKKTQPSSSGSGRPMKDLSGEDLEKAKKEMEAITKRRARLEAAIAAAESKAKVSPENGTETSTEKVTVKA